MKARNHSRVASALLHSEGIAYKPPCGEIAMCRIALSYRGYGGSSGRPTENGLVEDADTAYAFAVAQYPAERIVLWGESLGSAVALALAAEKSVGCLVLEAPFTSAVDVGARH